MTFESFPVHKNQYDMSVDKESWIDDIVGIIRNMERNDDILVYDFGEKGNLKLVIIMDDDTDIRIFVDAWSDPADGGDCMVYPVYGSDLFYKTELEEIKKELLYIWSGGYEK